MGWVSSNYPLVIMFLSYLLFLQHVTWIQASLLNQRSQYCYNAVAECYCSSFGIHSFPYNCDDERFCAAYNETCVTSCPKEAPFRSPGGLCVEDCPRQYTLRLVEPKWTACFSECPLQYAPVEDICSPCAGECLGCNGVSNSDCLECRYSWFNGSCVFSCPDYMARFEDTCYPRDHCRHVIYEGDCLASCPAGFYPEVIEDSDYKMCRPCHKECQYECVGGRNDQCNSCKHFQYNGTCIAKCPAYAPVTFNSKCFSSCPYFMLQGKCIHTCPLGKLGFNHSCVETCPPIAPISRKGHCVDSCSSVLHNNECLDRCPPSFYLYNETCVEHCPTVAPIMNSTHCVDHCSDFYLSSHCVQSCPERYSIYNRSCTLKCPADSRYRDPATLECKPECPYYLAAFNCRLTCPGALVGFNHTCLPKCPNTTVENDGTCISQCPTNGPRKYLYQRKCVTECPRQKPVSVNETCIETCPQTLLRDTNNACVRRCSKYYESFVYNSRCMHMCPAEAPVYVNQTCFQKCPSQLLQDWNNNCVETCSSHASYIYNKTCVSKCPNHAPFSANHRCARTCPKVYYINGHDCVRTCLPHQVIRGSRCVKINCSSETPRIFNKKCVNTCPSSHIFLQENACVTKCPGGWKYSGTTLTTCVQSCSGSNCYPSCLQPDEVYTGDQCSHRCKKGQLRFKYICLNSCETYDSYNLVMTEKNECDIGCPPSKPLVDSIENNCLKKCSSSYNWVQYKGKCVLPEECPRSWGIDLRGICVEQCKDDAKVIPVLDNNLDVAFQCAPYYTARTQAIVVGLSVFAVAILMVYSVMLIRFKWKRWKAAHRTIDAKLDHLFNSPPIKAHEASSTTHDVDKTGSSLDNEGHCNIAEGNDVNNFPRELETTSQILSDGDRSSPRAITVFAEVEGHEIDEAQSSHGLLSECGSESNLIISESCSRSSRDLNRLRQEHMRNLRMKCNLLQDSSSGEEVPLLFTSGSHGVESDNEHLSQSLLPESPGELIQMQELHD